MTTESWCSVLALSLLAAVFGCGPTAPSSHDAAPLSPLESDASQDAPDADKDAGTPAPMLGAACAADADCSAGLFCFLEHKSEIGIDMFARCTARCFDADTVFACDVMGGLCGCPSASGDAGECPAGVGMVCIPSEGARK